jgi:hypothetical protein
MAFNCWLKETDALRRFCERELTKGNDMVVIEDVNLAQPASELRCEV